MKRGVVVSLALSLVLASLAARAEHAGDRTGVLPETITIGLHVPFTGASPIPAQAVDAGASMYWRYLHDELGTLVHGRRVEVLVRDDSHTPSTAVQNCNELSASAFMLLGVVGADQIGACAGFSDERGIPYASPGVQEVGLADRTTYAALSPSWRATAPIIAEFVAHELKDEVDLYGATEPYRLPIVDIEVPLLLTSDAPDGHVKVGLVRPNTPNYNDLEDALRSSLEALGQEFESYTVVKEGTGADADRVARQMAADDIEVVVAATGGVFTFMLAANMAARDYDPRFITMGTTAGFNFVARQACDQGSFDKASSFSPWPGWAEVDAGEFDPTFSLAADLYAAEVNTSTQGDVLVALWGLMKDVHAMLDAAGPDPTREDFNAMMDSGFSASTGVYPDLSFAPDDPFGAQAIHRLEVDCDTDGTFHQADAFVTGYPAE